jgi:enoyl-CoA hydratase
MNLRRTERGARHSEHESGEAPVLVTRDGPVMTVAFNRPEKLNALTPEMFIRIAQAWYELRDDEELRVGVVTNTSTRALTAGADLDTTVPLLAGARSPQDKWEMQFLADLSIMNDALLRDLELFKPVIAAIEGVAVGAGTEILLASDLRVISETARLGLPEVTRALIPGGGSITRLRDRSRGRSRLRCSSSAIRSRQNGR